MTRNMARKRSVGDKPALRIAELMETEPPRGSTSATAASRLFRLERNPDWPGKFAARHSTRLALAA